MAWTPQSAARLVALWNDDKSAGAIAAALAREFSMPFSRNAVIGKIGRLRAGGVPLREGGGRYCRPAAARPRSQRLTHTSRARLCRAAIPPDAMAQEPPPSAIAPPAWPPDGTCLWLHGDPKTAAARWCGAAVHDPGAGMMARYCPFHARAVVAPSNAGGGRHAS